jgi:ribulose kinase
MSDQDRAARGRRALHEMEEVGLAFDKVEAAIIRTLAETPIGQEAKVLNLHKSLQNLAAVKQAIRDVINDGQVAEYAIAVAGLTRAAA